MHVLVQERDELGLLNNLEAKIHGVRYALVMAMSGGIELHMLGEMLHLFGRPGLIGQFAAFHNSSFRFAAQEKTARVRKNRIGCSAGTRLPTPLDIGLA